LGKTQNVQTISVILAVCDVLMGDVKDSVSKLVCPFCGRRFRVYGSLVAHLTRISPCSAVFTWSVRYVAEAYIKLVEKVRRCYIGGRIGRCLDVGGLELRFRTSKELADFIRRNPELILEIVDGSGG